MRRLRLSGIVSALFIGAVSVNALLLQDGHHPAPLFGAAPQDAGDAATAGEAAGGAGGAVIEAVDMSPSAAEQARLTEALQRSLLRLGYYTGPVDGLYGPQTRAGLAAYQRAHALPEDGTVTEALVRHAERQGRSAVPLPPRLRAGSGNSGGPEG